MAVEIAMQLMDPTTTDSSYQLHDNEMGILQRRRIEAQIIQPIYEILKRDFGIEQAQKVISEAIANAAIKNGQEFAAKEQSGTSMESFVALQHLWEKDDALDIQVLQNNHDHYDYNVTRCRYAEMYHEMGLGDIGFLLSCNRDSKFIEGYAPHIQLEREHTVMQGHGFCDFRYRRCNKTSSALEPAA